VDVHCEAITSDLPPADLRLTSAHPVPTYTHRRPLAKGSVKEVRQGKLDAENGEWVCLLCNCQDSRGMKSEAAPT
jgi:hypothetical protein